MKTHTTIRSWRALAVAGLILMGTCFVLFQDVIHGAAITGGHVLTALALLIATAASHQIVPTFKVGRYALALNMIVLAIGATTYIGLMSGARNAEQTATKAHKIDARNADRSKADSIIRTAEGELEDLKAAETAECRKVGAQCEKKANRRKDKEISLEDLRARRAVLGADEVPNAGYKAIAEGIVLLPWFTHHTVAEVERALVILLPWLAVLLAEFSVPAFLSLALGHEAVQSLSDRAQTSFSATAAPDVRALLSASAPENDGVPPPKGRSSRKTAAPAAARKTTASGNVVAFPARHPVIGALETAGRRLSNGELAAAMKCSDSEASKRCKEVAGELDLGWNGRFRSIGLKAWSRQASA